jgi:hypothetical protein
VPNSLISLVLAAADGATAALFASVIYAIMTVAVLGEVSELIENPCFLGHLVNLLMYFGAKQKRADSP